MRNPLVIILLCVLCVLCGWQVPAAIAAGPGSGYVDIWLVGPRPPVSAPFAVEVWVSPHEPNAPAQLSEISVLFDWDPRYLSLRGSIYQPAQTWSRGPDLPATWSGGFPLRDACHANDTWTDGNALLRLKAAGVCNASLRVDRPLKVATLWFIPRGSPPAAVYIDIDWPFCTRAVGRYNADPCASADRAVERIGCWVTLYQPTENGTAETAESAEQEPEPESADDPSSLRRFVAPSLPNADANLDPLIPCSLDPFSP